jgi:uncharacterized membrane protein YhaH (DUF805 family)
MLTTQRQGYIFIATGAPWAAVAIDRMFYHVDRPLGWFTVAIALASLVIGAKRLHDARRA